MARAVIVPGNGCTPVRSCNWYEYMKDALLKRSDLVKEVILRDMPDPHDAKESVWLPFILSDLGVGSAPSILVGHSSGAEAAMRLLENNKLVGCVLVAACHTDLGSLHERLAGYYSRPWQWDKIKENAGWILQFHSEDDPFIPRREADHVASSLKLEEGVDYFCFKDRSHFFSPREIDPVIEIIIKKLEETTTFS